MGPNPHEQRGIEAHRRERTGRLDRPFGTQIGARSRRIAGTVAVALVAVVLVLVILGWLDLLSTNRP